MSRGYWWQNIKLYVTFYPLLKASSQNAPLPHIAPDFRIPDIVLTIRLELLELRLEAFGREAHCRPSSARVHLIQISSADDSYT